MKSRIKNNYHWVMATVSILAMLVVGGVGNSFNGVILIPITESLGVTRGEYSRAMMVSSISGMILNLFSGVLFIKFGYRKLVTASLILSAVGYAIGFGSQNLSILCVAGVLMGMSGLCTLSGNPRLLGSWFHRHYGLVMGVVTAMTGLGGSLFSIILSKVLTAAGWRYIFLMVAGLFFVIALLIALLVRNKPAEIGLKPYGEGYLPKNTKKDTEEHWHGFPMTELKKKPAFYLLVVGTFLSTTCSYMALNVINAHVQDCGMDAEFAASVQSLVMFALAAVKLGFGYLSDVIGAKKVALIALIAGVVSMLLLADITGPTSAYIAALVYSVGLTITGAVPPLLVPSLFGYQSGPKAMGIVLAMVSAAGIVANPLTNSLRDAIGSYRPVFRMTALVSAGVMVLYLVIFALSAKDRREFEKSQPVPATEENA